ncbi:hypothetical protein RI367_005740 [Sorochytrium milnesiophthora]
MATLADAQNYSKDLKGLGLQIGLTTAISVACIGGFVVLRRSKRLGHLYTSRLRRGKDVDPNMPTSLLGVIKYVLLLPDERIVTDVGLDAAVFMRFVVMCVQFCALMSVTVAVVLIPLHLTGDVHQPSDSLGQFTSSNIPQNSGRYWVHFVATWFVSFVLYALLYRTYEWYAYTAQAYLLARARRGDVHMRTVMVRGLPPALQDERRLMRFFTGLNLGAVEKVSLVRNMGKLESKLGRHRDCLRALERAHIDLASEVYKGEIRAWWDVCGCVDRSRHWRQKLQRLGSRLSQFVLRYVLRQTDRQAGPGRRYKTRTVTRGLLRSRTNPSTADRNYSNNRNNNGTERTPANSYHRNSLFMQDTIKALDDMDDGHDNPEGIDAELDGAGEDAASDYSTDSDAEAENILRLPADILDAGEQDIELGPLEAHQATYPPPTGARGLSGLSGIAKTLGRQAAADMLYAQTAMHGRTQSPVTTFNRSSMPFATAPDAPAVPGDRPRQGSLALPPSMLTRSRAPSLAASLHAGAPLLETPLQSPAVPVPSPLPPPALPKTREELTWPTLMHPGLRPLLDQYQPMHFTKYFGIIPTGTEVLSIDYHLSKLMYYDRRIQELRDVDANRIRYKPTPTAFITFQSPIAAAVCAQSLTISMPPAKTRLAPEPRDVIWNSYALGSSTSRMLTRLIVGIVIGFVILAWLLPISSVVVSFNLSFLYTVVPALKPLISEKELVKSFLSNVLPSLAATVFNILFPYILFALLKLQWFYSTSQFMEKLTMRYIQFSFLNVLVFFMLGQTFLPAILAMLKINLNLKLEKEKLDLDVPNVLRLIAAAVPSAGLFYLNYVIFQTCLHALELLQFNWGIFFALITTSRWSAPTPRDYYGATQPWMFYYYYYYTSCVLICIIVFTFGIFNPLIFVFGLLYFAFAYFVYKHQLLYVYVSRYETNGRIWPKIFDWVLYGMLLFQVITISILLLNGSYAQPVLILPLLGVTWWVRWYCHRMFLPMSRNIPIDSQLDGRSIPLDGRPRAASTSQPGTRDRSPAPPAGRHHQSAKSRAARGGIVQLDDGRNSWRWRWFERYVLSPAGAKTEQPGKGQSHPLFANYTPRQPQYTAVPDSPARALLGADRDHDHDEQHTDDVRDRMPDEHASSSSAAAAAATTTPQKSDPVQGQADAAVAGAGARVDFSPTAPQTQEDDPQVYTHPCVFQELPQCMWLAKDPVWHGVYDLSKCEHVEDFCYSSSEPEVGRLARQTFE